MNKRTAKLLTVMTLFMSLTVSNLAFAHLGAGAQEMRSNLTANDRVKITVNLKADIAQLSRDQRFSTSKYQRAVEYVRAQARSVGFDVTTEPVEGIAQWERGDSDRAELILPNGTREDLHIVALTGSANGEVEGEVTLVNYFFDRRQGPPPTRFDEGNNKRLVLFSRALDRDRSPTSYSRTVVQRNLGAAWAGRYGASATLVRSIQTGNGPPHGGAVAYPDKAQGSGIPSAALSVEDADRIEKLLCHGKLSTDPDNSQLCDGKAQVHLKIAPKQTARIQENVLIRITGTAQPNKIVLVGAHLDSHDVTPGAADDAAGVAAVLAVMRELAKNRPAVTVLLVLFADEELKGSGERAFVKQHEKELSQIVSATEIDDGDGPPLGVQITSREAQRTTALVSLRSIVDRVGADAAGLEMRTDTNTNSADTNLMWENYGIPEVAILQDFTNYFNKHHASNDTPENIDLEGIARTTFLLIRIVDALSSGALTPPRGSPSSSN